MIITEMQRFICGLLALTFAMITVLMSLNVYVLAMFLVLIIIEFLALVELTKPAFLHVSWRENITVFVLLCIVIFYIILYQRVVATLR